MQGVIQPDVGDPEDLILDFIDSTKTRRTAARPWSPPAGAPRASPRCFPPDLPVGEVTKASIVEQEASQQVHVRPYADLRNLDLVQVLTGGSRG